MTHRHQTIRIHNNISSSSITFRTGSSQGCVLNPLLFTLLIYDCSVRHHSSHIVKFANNTAVEHIINNNESKYKVEIEHLVQWCKENNLCINRKMIKEIVVDFRRDEDFLLPMYIGGAAVDVVSRYRYLGVQ